MQTVSTNIYQLAPCRVASFESPRRGKLIYGSADNRERGQDKRTKAQPFGPAPKHVSPSRCRAHFPLKKCSYLAALPVVRAKSRIPIPCAFITQAPSRTLLHLVDGNLGVVRLLCLPSLIDHPAVGEVCQWIRQSRKVVKQEALLI